MKDAIEILNLINLLTPVGVDLVKTFSAQLQGKSDEELKTIADTLDDSVIATAEKELGTTE
jgi:hypothetical protein